MKKTLTITLALVFVLGIAGSAFAANPFSDVPANHWAYASISKLAEAGIIEGYGSGRFVGSSNITRYEAAQIIAKALARSDKADAAQKAQIERLAAEFAKELESLGVRVGKLEKRIDNTTITGEIRFANYAFDEPLSSEINNNGSNNSKIRTRLTVSGQVNDKWKYGGLLEHNGQNFRTNTNGSEGVLTLRRAWVNGKIGVVDVTAGRFYYKPVYGAVFDEDADGLKLTYKNAGWDFDLFALRPTITNDRLWTTGARSQVYGAKLGYSFTKALSAQLAYYDINRQDDNAPESADNSIVEFALGYKFSKDFSVFAEFLRGERKYLSTDTGEGSKTGWSAGINYGALARSKAGSYALRAVYYDLPASTYINTTPELDPNIAGGSGFKGYTVGGSYILAKNIEFALDYFDFDSKKGDDYDNNLLWTRVLFYF